MDGGMGSMRMGGGGGSDMSMMTPLTPDGFDLSNMTQAMDFLGDILNDDELKIIGNAHATYFWYGVAVFIGLATVVNVLTKLTLRSRIRAAARRESQPARPQHVVMRYWATITAMIREATYFQLTPRRTLFGFKVPPAGTILLVLSHFIFVLVLEFANNSVPGAQYWQARGVRAGWLAVAQVPLLVLLVMKTNVVGYLTGVTIERLNVFHRWAARITLFLAILHFGYQSHGWQKFGLMELEWTTDACPPTGIAAFALLLWINISNLVPFRFWSYEVFVWQHIISFFGFIIALTYHLPTTALTSRVYVFVPIALYCMDRILRTIWFSYINTPGRSATLTSLDGGVTKIVLSNQRVRSWNPGSFVLLSIPRFGLLQCHPATIVSTPKSHNGDMVFLLKGHKGFTKRIMHSANSSTTALLPHSKQEVDIECNNQKTVYRAFINGPYGGGQSDFAAFDSVCLMAGSTGVTFTLSILQDLAERASEGPQRLPVRRVHFLWCVKDTSWTKWCNDEISQAFSKLRKAGIDIQISIYVTCSDVLTDSEEYDWKNCACECDKSLGPCCCVQVVDSDESLSEKDGVNQSASYIGKRSAASSIRDAADGITLRILPCASFRSGRPNISNILFDLLEWADGESAVAVCGSVSMSAEVRNATVKLSDELAIHKGGGCQGLYLHVESFS